MIDADLPKEKAFEPVEEAHQPKQQANMHCQNPAKKLTFAKDVDLSGKTLSQKSSSYKDILSQPPNGVTHSQKLIWLQKRRTAGLWAQCDDCDRWRYLPFVLDRHELPVKWYCWMNVDKEFASCSVPEAPLRLHDEEDLIHSEYAAGSLVLARLGGWPWWPAMVDDCPDTEQYYWLDGFSDIPTHYNVVFFDAVEATRAWIAPEQLKTYSQNKNIVKGFLKDKKYNRRLKAAISQANEAEKLPLEKRLERFSFIARHKGVIFSPKKMKKADIEKYKRQFKKKFNIDFPVESSESDDDYVAETTSKKDNNVIIMGTPKRARRENNFNKEQNEESNLTTNVEPRNFKINECVLDSDKPPNSMLVQIGSTDLGSIENDTSATYVPEETPRTELSIRMETPNSDDFDF
ncbi:hypothetical protein SFRURICE_016142 [Spodoptera frugiperda]|uniref:SFRICE_020517 n=1 Tax=Spodoptera frugiperda TaxID=7108 RepID=A0A2H1X274_SPOFR|nr:hypothetical protein SFRURICE_016142 [Spodoptera frugiperda]